MIGKSSYTQNNPSLTINPGEENDTSNNGDKDINTHDASNSETDAHETSNNQEID